MSKLTGLAALAALALAGCKQEEAPRAAAAPAPVAAAAPAATVVEPAPAPSPAPTPVIDAAAPAAAAGGGGTITIGAVEPVTAGDALGQRCTLDGDPLAIDCHGGSLAVAPGGAVYVTDQDGVRRYQRRADAATCELALDPRYGGGEVGFPTRAPKPQQLGKGPVYLSSGGPRWRLVAAGASVYAHDFLLGLWRIDRGKAEPVCPDLQGAHAWAIAGSKAVIARNGGERVALGGACKATAAGFEPALRTGVYAAGAAVLGEDGGKLVRYGARGEEVARMGADDSFAPGGLCSVTAVAACGDDVCVVDGNCQKVVRFAADGTFVLERKARALFAPTPYGLAGAAAGPDDGLYVLATQRDGDTCEGAIYWVPGAAIAP